MTSAKRHASIDIRRIIYATGNFGKNLLWGTTEVTLLFVMTDMLHIRPDLAGAILLVSLVVDAVLDPIVGVLSDTLHSRIGRYGPFILIGAPLAGVSFAGLYALPWLGIASPLVAGALIMAFRIAYSLIDMPHNALLAAVTPDSAGRARLTMYRFFFSSLGSLVVALALAPMVAAGSGGALSASRLAAYGAAAGLASMLVMIAAWRAVAVRDSQFSRSARDRAPVNSLVRTALSSPAFRRALGAGMIAALTIPLFPKSLLYLTGPVLGRPDLASTLLTVMIMGQFCGLALWMALSNRWSVRRSLAASHCTCAAGLALVLAALAGWPALILPGSFIIGLGASGVYSLIWSLVADSARLILERTGADVHGVVFSIAILSQKMAIGVGVAGLGMALAASGYRSGMPATGPVAMTIVVAALVVPLLGALAAAGLLGSGALAGRVRAAPG